MYNLTTQNWNMITFYFNPTSILIYPLTTMNLFAFDMDLFIELMLFIVIVGLVLYSVKQYPKSKVLLGIWLILLIFYLAIALLISELPFTVILIIFTFLIIYLVLHLFVVFERKRN
jgi:hypothetical protein